MFNLLSQCRLSFRLKTKDIVYLYAVYIVQVHPPDVFHLLQGKTIVFPGRAQVALSGVEPLVLDVLDRLAINLFSLFEINEISQIFDVFLAITKISRVIKTSHDRLIIVVAAGNCFDGRKDSFASLRMHPGSTYLPTRKLGVPCSTRGSLED